MLPLVVALELEEEGVPNGLDVKGGWLGNWIAPGSILICAGALITVVCRVTGC